MKATIRLTTEEEKLDPSIPAFDYTKLTALNTCPRWGLIRYDQHKRMPGEGRAMALELGAAAHEAFAAIRWFELMISLPTDGNEILEASAYGHKLFGTERYEYLLGIIASGEDTNRRAKAIALYAANTSGFYDDPNDRRRTLSNLESSLLAYIDRIELCSRVPVVRDGLVGIEVPFDLCITFHKVRVDPDNPKFNYPYTRIRYIGRMDGLVNTRYGIEVEENKTAARLDNAWQESFLISHQVTGYCVAASTILQQPVTECVVRGMMIPLPKNYDLGGIVNVPITRSDDRKREWLLWIWHTLTHQYLPYRDDPLQAPEYSHSCNRYFRPCPFIPLCGMEDREDRLLAFSQMTHDEWSPLHDRG